MDARWTAGKLETALRALGNALTLLDRGDGKGAREALYPALSATLKCFGTAESELQDDRHQRYTPPLRDFLYANPQLCDDVLHMIAADNTWNGHREYWQAAAESWERHAANQPRPPWMDK